MFHKSQMMCFVWRSGGAAGLGCEKKELFEKALISEVACERDLGKM